MAKEELPHLMFVYGTLKRGEPNECQMAAEYGRCQFVGCGETKMKYPLVVATAYNIPFMLNEEGQGHNVKGELYLVDDKMKEHLDEFEYHPHLYLRQEATINLTHDSHGNDVTPTQTKECWVYFLSRRHEEMLQMTYLPEYKSASKENPSYVIREEREVQVSLMEMVFPGNEKVSH